MGGADPAADKRRAITALAITETVSWGVLYYAFAVVIVPMQAELGWSTALLAGGLSLGLLVSGLLAPAVGAWIDAHGPRMIMTAGSLTGTAAVVAWAAVRTPAAFFAVWTLMGAAMAATLYEPAVAAVAAYERAQRLRALLFVTMAAGLASTVFSPLTGALDARLGWRAALLCLAAVLALVTVPLHAGMPTVGRNRPAVSTETKPAAWTREDLRRVTVAFTVAKAVSVGVTAHLVAFLVTAGHSSAAAASLAGAVGIGKIGGRVLVMAILQRTEARRVSASVVAFQGLALGLPLVWSSQVGVLVMVVLFGAAAGATTILRPTVVGDRFGSAAYGRRNGLVALAERVAASAAPLLVGVGVSVTNDYAAAWMSMAVLSLAVGAWLAASR